MTKLGYTVALSAALAACGGETALEDTEGAIVGGRPARSAALNSVGALVTVGADGTLDPFCTATLFSAHHVVTAKHCALLTPASARTAFAIGPDARHPSRLIPVDRYVWERTVSEGFMGLGADVAVAHLTEAVSNIAPARANEARRSELRQNFQAVGYGQQSLVDNNAPSGARRQAAVKLVAIGPDQYYQAVYRGDFEAFFAALWPDATPMDTDFAELMAIARDIWENSPLTPRYDAVFERVTGNTAPGDSGGPVFSHDDDDQLRTVGVTSGIATISADFPDSVANDFTIYTTFGPEAQHLLRSAEACGDATEEGVCRGDVRARCTSLAETHGRPQVLTQDCAARGRTCAMKPSGAACVPPCASNADCTDGSKCRAGRCTWSAPQLCTGEATPDACFLCCLGRGTGGDFSDSDFAVCERTCFPPEPAIANAAPHIALRFPGFPQLRPLTRH